MADVISKLTPEQALHVVERLGRKGGKLREAVVAEAMHVLTEIDPAEVAEEVLLALDSIDVEDLWGRSGRSRDDYTPPDEAAAEMVEEELRPFSDQVERYHALGMHEQEAVSCMGLIWGVYRYERESESEFKTWSADAPAESAGLVLDEWRARNREAAHLERMKAFLRQHCPDWVRWLNDRQR